MTTWADLEGTQWEGKAELWLDPLGDDVARSECTASLGSDALRYTWSHEGKTHEGRIALRAGGGEFSDGWHQPEPMDCTRVANAPGLFQIQGRYGPQQEWQWRIGLFLREPTGELVLQMTNIAPWGEEARAVRMTLRRS